MNKATLNIYLNHLSTEVEHLQNEIRRLSGLPSVVEQLQQAFAEDRLRSELDIAGISREISELREKVNGRT